MKIKIRRILSAALAVLVLFSLSPRARAWCFILPESITYGYSADGLSAGNADAVKEQPDIEDFIGGRVLMANIYSIDAFDVVLSDASSVISTIHVLKGQAVGLTDNKRRYFIVGTNPMAQGSTLSDQTDVWAKGNWPYWYPNMISEVRDGALGGFIRLTPYVIQIIDRVPTQARITNIIRFGTEDYASPHAVPNSAAEAPFSTALFTNVPVIELCVYDECNLDGLDSGGSIPLFVNWTLKRKI